jgi:hypothetical protein
MKAILEQMKGLCTLSPIGRETVPAEGTGLQAFSLWSRRVGRRRGAFAVIALASTLLFAVGAFHNPVEASFPGENGRFLLTWTTEPVFVTTDFLATASRQASDLRVIADCEYECHHRSGDWSPNGRRLAYIDECPDCLNKLVTVAPSGRHRRVVYRATEGVDGFLSSPAWSPNGRRIAFVEYRYRRAAGDYISDIYVIRRDGSHLSRVTHTRRRSEDSLDWSSRNLLVFSSSRGRSRFSRYELFAMRPNGRELRKLTDNAVLDDNPDWAPGGRRLVFVRGRDEIWTKDGSGNESLIASGHSPTWAPDGSVIAFMSEADGAIHTVRPSGGDDTLIGSPVEEGEISELDWQPR